MNYNKTSPFLDDKKHDTLLAALHKKQSSLEKINFWYKELKLNWLDLYTADSYQDVPLEPFKFEIKEDEYEEINRWILANYLKLSAHPRKENNVLVLEKMIDEFENELLQYDGDKLTRIQQELMKIDHSFRVTNRLFGRSSTPIQVNLDYNVNPRVYFDFLKVEYEPSYKDVPSNVHNVLRTANAIVLGRYTKYLNEQLREIKRAPQIADEGITKAQKILLLDSLGGLELLSEKIPIKAKQIKILGMIIGANADNIKKDLNQIHKKDSRLKKKENYEFLVMALSDTPLEQERIKAEEVLKAIYQSDLK